jgi:hypothetical protein
MKWKRPMLLCHAPVSDMKTLWQTVAISLLAVVIGTLSLPRLSEASHWIPFEPSSDPTTSTTVEVSQVSPDTMTISISCPGLSLREVTSNGTAWVVPTIANEGLMEQPGLPRLPVVRRLIAVPESESVSVTATTGDSLVVQLSTRVMLCEKTIPLGHGLHAEANTHWGDTSPPPGELAEISGEARIRDLRVLCLSIYPARYTEEAGCLTCYKP